MLHNIIDLLFFNFQFLKNPAQVTPILIPRSEQAKIPDPKAYALRFAGIMGLVAVGPLAGGIAGLIYDNKRAAIALIVGMVFSLWGATQLIKKVM